MTGRMQIYGVIRDRQPISAQEIADIVGSRRGTVSVHLSRLLSDGWVRIVRWESFEAPSGTRQSRPLYAVVDRDSLDFVQVQRTGDTVRVDVGGTGATMTVDEARSLYMLLGGVLMDGTRPRKPLNNPY